MNKASCFYKAKLHDPHASFWLRTPTTLGGWGRSGDVYMYHICPDGSCNPFACGEAENGVRPALWIDAEALSKLH